MSVHCSIRQASVRSEQLNEGTLALAADCVAVRDSIDPKTIYYYDVRTGKPVGDQKHVHSVLADAPYTLHTLAPAASHQPIVH
jgi:hypothetical protein